VEQGVKLRIREQCFVKNNRQVEVQANVDAFALFSRVGVLSPVWCHQNEPPATRSEPDVTDPAGAGQTISYFGGQDASR